MPGQTAAPLQCDRAQVCLANAVGHHQDAVVGEQRPLLRSESVHDGAASFGVFNGALILVIEHRVGVNQGGRLIIDRWNTPGRRPH
ncbi:hypothetical protein D3C87_1772600 [compost metagenome]